METVQTPINFYPTSSPRDADLTRWQLSSTDILLELERDLKGQEYDETLRKWVKNNNTIPLMNDKGVRAVVSILRPIVNKNTFLSNLKEDRVNQILLFTANRISECLYFNYREFDIKPEFYFIVNEMIQNFLETAFRRPQEQGERRFLTSSEQRRVIVQDIPEQKKTFSIFGRLGGGK